MIENILATASRLSDETLVTRIKASAGRERDATAELVAYLSELYGRRAHLPEGSGRLFSYCHHQLGFSEDAAWNRAAAAEAVRRYPVILDWLFDGTLNVTTVRILRPVLTPENHLAVLSEARRRSKRKSRSSPRVSTRSRMCRRWSGSCRLRLRSRSCPRHLQPRPLRRPSSRHRRRGRSWPP